MLDQAHVDVVDKDAAAQLRIISESFDKKVLSVDAFGRAYEYDLEYSLNYALVLQNNNVAATAPEDMPNGVILLSGSYRFDPLAVLAAHDEEQRVLAELRQQALTQMLRHLAKFPTNPTQHP
jgi:LPS-assembly lipoprotein